MIIGCNYQRVVLRSAEKVFSLIDSIVCDFSCFGVTKEPVYFNLSIYCFFLNENTTSSVFLKQLLVENPTRLLLATLLSSSFCVKVFSGLQSIVFEIFSSLEAFSIRLTKTLLYLEDIIKAYCISSFTSWILF